VHYVRRRFLVPLAHWGGRDMLLLRNGQWIDAAPGVPAGQIVWRYNAAAHQLHRSGQEGTRLARWPWLSVANESHDLSDFFGGLRITAGQELTKDKAFMLYAHQRGHLPYGTVTIMKRTGAEEVVHTYEDGGVVGGDASPASASVNYVR